MSKRTRNHSSKGSARKTVMVKPTSPPDTPPYSVDSDDRVALAAHSTNIALSTLAVLIYLFTKDAYTNPLANPAIEPFRQSILPIAAALALAKPLLTAIVGPPLTSWSVSSQRAFALVRTALSIALLAVVAVVPVYVSGFPDWVQSFVQARLPASASTVVDSFSKVTFDSVVTFATTGLSGLVVQALVGYFVNVVHKRRSDQKELRRK